MYFLICYSSGYTATTHTNKCDSENKEPNADGQNAMYDLIILPDLRK